MPHIPHSMLQNQVTSSAVVEGSDWNKEIEPQIRATALRQTLVSTQLLALQDPRLNPVVTPVADGLAVFHGLNALGSFAREIGTSRPVSPDELDTLEQFYADHGCPVRVWVSARTHDSLLQMLRNRGYVSSSHSLIWLRSLANTPISCEQRDIEILPVPVDLYKRWSQTVAAGFFEGTEPVLPGEIPPSFLDLFFALGCAPDDQAFLARKHGQFVGGGVLHMGDGIAMLRTASTRFIHRNMGVHQALLVARLICAREQGARIAVSQTLASGPSPHNLRKLGFQPLRSGCMMEKRIVQ